MSTRIRKPDRLERTLGMPLVLQAAIRAIAIVTLLCAAGGYSVQAQTFVILHSFTGGSDGANPYGGLVADSLGNLYGTTFWGGKGVSEEPPSSGAGVVYKIRPK